MTAGNAFTPSRLLILDTFRQAKASGITAMMLVVTAVCGVLCLSVRITNDVSLHAGEDPPLFLPSNLPRVEDLKGPISPEAKSILLKDPAVAQRDGPDLIRGEVSLAFGAITFPLARERVDSVRFLETVLGGAIAGTFGLLLALVWTAGFMPTFLETGAIAVLIAKPVKRRTLFLGKYVGVMFFMGCQVALFVGLTWLALGVRTGVWDPTDPAPVRRVLRLLGVARRLDAKYGGMCFRLAPLLACVVGYELRWCHDPGYRRESSVFQSLVDGGRNLLLGLAQADRRLAHPLQRTRRLKPLRKASPLPTHRIAPVLFTVGIDRLVARAGLRVAGLGLL